MKVPTDLVTGEIVHAPFHGARSATAPLTWGQRSMWRSPADLAGQGIFLHLPRRISVPSRARADVPAVAAALGALVGRHESLRTRIRPVDGEPAQVAADHGRLPLLVADGGDDPDGGAATARELMDRLGATPFDLAEEWPLRVALVVVDDRVRHLVIVFSHGTVDFHGAEIVLRDLRQLLLRGTVSGPAGLQTIDVARREAGRERHRSTRSVAHWSDGFRRLPASMFDPVGPALEPPYRQALLTSEALDLATRLVAGRHRVSTSTVLLAATTAVVAARQDAATCGVLTMAGNRFQPGYGDAVAKLNQIGLCVVDLADRPDFTALLHRTAAAALDAYRYAYYDPLALDQAMADLGHDPRTVLEPYCYLNDIRLPRHPGFVGPAPDEATVRAATARTTITWLDPPPAFLWRCRMQVIDVPGALGVVLTVNTRYLPPGPAEEFLLDLERLLVEAAFRDVPWPWSAGQRPAAA
ncbi:condensation domain-containing protein [Polymorphospora rubra]|uniref:condensation domain-containing protein n=1 Tax=Polymorphospora rubra TaxID=338584 RepID=UPI0033E03A25